MELGDLSPKLCPSSPPGVAWATVSHPPSGWDIATLWAVPSTGVLQAKEMRWDRVSVDELPEKAPGALGGRTRDAVTPLPACVTE